MPYITREDGERFVIPSYRDVLTANQTSQLKREIRLLSQSYGEYITLQKKSVTQYEVAFSTETGYLLGESIWHHFNKPEDLIYCEAIPNTMEAILVIVKNGSVYLDGSFPLDSIPEELIIFLTQQNNFEIYIYGDVPISQEPEAGKFSFEASSVKKFEVLTNPIFPKIPLLKIYQLQLVDIVLKAHGIGGVPVAPIVGLILLAAAAWLGWSYFSSKPAAMVEEKQEINPYAAYFKTLASPAPDSEVNGFLTQLNTVSQIPGWMISGVKYTRGGSTFDLKSNGGKVEGLYAWAQNNKADVVIRKEGISLRMMSILPNRPDTTTISPIDKVIGVLVDRLSNVYPGNHMSLRESARQGVYNEISIVISFQIVSPGLLALIGKQFEEMPLVLQNIAVTSFDASGNLSGSITLEVLGK